MYDRCPKCNRPVREYSRCSCDSLPPVQPTHYEKVAADAIRYRAERLAHLRRDLATASEMGALYIKREIAHIESLS